MMKNLSWSVLAVLVAVMFWLSLALVNAENQRYAMLSKACADPVFKGEIDSRCLETVQSRPHWWQHLGHALMHVRG